MEIVNAFTGFIGAVTGVISFIWLIRLRIIEQWQDLQVKVAGVRRPRNYVGEILRQFDQVTTGVPPLPQPDEVYLEVTNSGNRRVVLRTIELINPNTGETVGGKSLRYLKEGQKDNQGVSLDVEQIDIIHVPMILKADKTPYVPSEDEVCQAVVISTRGKRFKSKPFCYRDFGEPDLGLGFQLIGDDDLPSGNADRDNRTS